MIYKTIRAVSIQLTLSLRFGQLFLVEIILVSYSRISYGF